MVANAKRLNQRLNRHQVDCRIGAMVVIDTNGQSILAFRPWIEDYPASKLDELQFAFRILYGGKMPHTV
eukprot:2888249-Pleurochrysis_carterae.AAC.4